MTDRIDGAIAASLERILRNWDPKPGQDIPGTVLPNLKDAIQEEIDWLGLS